GGDSGLAIILKILGALDWRTPLARMPHLRPAARRKRVRGPERRFRIGRLPTNNLAWAYSRAPYDHEGAPMSSRPHLLLLALAIWFCGGPAVAQDRAAGGPVTVFAAASMKNALDDINTAVTAATGIKVVTSYGASSALMKQIESGAPADVFV